MFDSSSRQRMISLRVTDFEYKLLKAEYRKHGFSSVSDLARLAIRQLIETTDPDRDMEMRIKEIEHRLEIVEAGITASRRVTA